MGICVPAVYLGRASPLPHAYVINRFIKKGKDSMCAVLPFF